MKSGPCPLLSAYFRALRAHLKKTPLLSEAELERLDVFEERLAAEPPRRPPADVRLLRAQLCLVIAFAEAGQQLKRLARHSTESVPIPEGAGIWDRVKSTLGDLAEMQQMLTGEMNLLGTGQRLEYAQLEAAGDVAALCINLQEDVERCRVGNEAGAESAGLHFYEALAAANTPLTIQFQYVEALFNINN